MHAPGTDIEALPLGMGMHAIGRVDGGALTLLEDARPAAGARVCLCVDRRGVWLVVGAGVRGVHVNGRPVQRKALLRAGDSIHVDGSEIVLGAVRAPAVPPPDAFVEIEADPRVVLRGIGGRHHGRSFTLDRPRLVGSAADADIRIDDPSFAARHARIGLQDGQVVLRGLDAGESSLVNGERHRDALLQPGDQLVFDAHHRFVLEAPLRTLGAAAEALPEPAAAIAPAGSTARRLPWLLLAALLLAAALSALLLL